MSNEVQSDDRQQFELLMTTLFTCRSVVKYNLTLGEEQKKDILTDIDTSLEVVRSSLLTSPSINVTTASISPLPANSPPILSLSEETMAPSDIVSNDNEQHILQNLYRMYHSYIDTNQDKSLTAFVSRFNDAIETIQEIQRTVEYNYQDTRKTSIEEPFHRVKVFVADLYYIFMEFMRVVSEILQQNNVQLDTEKLNSLQGERTVDEKPPSQHDLASLCGAYEAHQRLNENRGVIAARIADATAFLEFLKEGLGTDVNRRDAFVLQLDNVIRLLHELSRLVTDYEKAAATLFCMK